MILRPLTELERQSQRNLRRDEFGQIEMAGNWRAVMTAQPQCPLCRPARRLVTLLPRFPIRSPARFPHVGGAIKRRTAALCRVGAEPSQQYHPLKVSRVDQSEAAHD